MRAYEIITEVFNQPYSMKWEKAEYGDYDALAKLQDGSNLHVMFEKETPDTWNISFYRNNSQEITGEGDAPRVFATVLAAIQKFIKKEHPVNIFFSASKATDSGEETTSRANLYNKMVSRYAQAWGYYLRAHDNGDLVMYELTRLKQGVNEGGWDTKKTQSTVIKPAVVALALNVIDKFTADFNRWLAAKNLGSVTRGRPTGSGTYYQQDTEENPDKIYGDIDLQMIAYMPDENMTVNQYNSYWNNLAEQFIKETQPNYIDLEDTKPGHPIVQIGANNYVQVDFMWHPPHLAHWGAARTTPERGVKGLLMGNLFSALGQLLNLSIQHGGVQLKTIDGQQVSFSKQKGVKLQTISANPETFVLDILKYYAGDNAQVDPLLAANPGIDSNNVKLASLVNAVKGLARSFELNGLYGKGVLADYKNANDFINKYITRYTEKAIADINSAKRSKAETPQAIARAEADRQAVQKGLNIVQGLFK
jgi:hypothetical protein